MSDTASLPPPARDDVLDGYVVETQIGYLLRRAHQRHVSIFAEWIGECELTPRQFAALVKVIELGRVTQNLLGRLAAMDPATIQGVVKRLSERGLIEREIDPLDRRTAVLTPTETGRAMLRQAVPAAKRVTAAVLAPLDAGERRILLALLGRLG